MKRIGCYDGRMKRTYRQNCALALSSDILGERWTLLIIRELLIQPCRFKDLNSVLIGMGTNLLTNRLKELEASGLIERQSKGDKRSPYQLSPRGLEAEPIVLAMIRWGRGQLVELREAEEGFTHQDHWDLLAMKALYNPELFQSKQITSITLVFKTEAFNAWVKANSEGLIYKLGLDSKLDSKLEEVDEIKNLRIEIPMTIAQLQQVLVENGQARKKLLRENPGLEKLVNCFRV